MNIFKGIYRGLLALPGALTPAFVAKRIDTESRSIDVFVRGFVVDHIRPEDLLLDAGSGSGQYRDALSKARYVATDFEQIFDQDAKATLDFVCDLEDIPKPDATYDVVVNIQVLEHVKHPAKVISELYRVLKPGGRLFLSTNQTFMMHGTPYCFYFFTKYGLEALFQEAGFKVEFVRPRGGMFWVLTKFLSLLPMSVYYQACYGGFKDGVRKPQALKRPILALVLLLPYVLSQIIFGTWLPFLLVYLDRLDRQKLATLGYECYCIKPEAS